MSWQLHSYMVQNILLIRAGALGDVILTLPALRRLRSRYPDARLRVIGYPALWDIARPLIDKAVSIDASLFAGLFTGSPSQQFCEWLGDVDLVVAWTVRDPRPSLERCGVPYVIHASPYPPPGVHTSRWLLQSVRAARGCPGEDTGAEHQTMLDLTDEELEGGREILATLGLERPIAIHPGAGAQWKRWPAERFSRLAEGLIDQDRQVLLIEGPADAEAVAEVREQVGARLPVLREPSLRLLAAVLSQCSLFVGNDSGVTHLAAAAGAPVQALFGPTDPACWAPGGKVQILRHCSRQATEHGQVRVCGNPTCMEGIEVAHVLESAMSTLSNVQNPVQNRPFSVDNFVDLPSIKSVRAIHHHFDTLSSEDRSRE